MTDHYMMGLHVVQCGPVQKVMAVHMCCMLLLLLSEERRRFLFMFLLTLHSQCLFCFWTACVSCIDNVGWMSGSLLVGKRSPESTVKF